MESPKRSRVNRCAWRRPSCQSRQSLSRGIASPQPEQDNFMKMSDPKIKDATLVELSVLSRDLRQEMFNLRLQQASAQLEKPARLRTLRKDIARVETRISQLRNKAA